MPLKNYGVLKATPVDRRLGSGDNPHYQILAVDEQDRYRLAVNVKSKQWPSELAYLIVPRFQHPITESLELLEPGWHTLPSKSGGIALDYIRANLFRSFTDMTLLAFSLPGPNNDLNEKIDRYVQRAMASENAWIYAFGEIWGPENKRDKIFGFLPGRGVHDVHMNQGNTREFVKDDGVWQDGAMLFWYPDQQEWAAIFLKFQSQAIHTDDLHGHALPQEPGDPPADHEPPIRPTPVWPPTHGIPDGLIRILAARINTIKSPEDETVILLNTSPQPIDLSGWALVDSHKRRKPLTGTLGPGEPLIVHVRPDIELSNKGGIISLLNAEGLKVHGVGYTPKQAQEPGWTIVF